VTITSQRRFFPTGYGKEVTDRLFGLRRRAATGNHDFDRLCAELDIEHAERCAALGMVHLHSPGSTRKPTLGADRGYDAAGPVTDLRQACVTPHVAQKARYSAIDGRTTRHKGYALSLKHRKRIEEAFVWAKTVGGMAQTMYRGVERVRSRFS